jgi:hypothetical protein
MELAKMQEYSKILQRKQSGGKLYSTIYQKEILKGKGTYEL